MTAIEGGHEPEATTRASRQSSPVPRSNHEDRTRYTHRSDTYTHNNFNQNRQQHQERSSNQSRFGDRDSHHSYYSPKPQNQYSQADHYFNNSSNPQHLVLNMSMFNISELIGSLQSQIIGLHLQTL